MIDPNLKEKNKFGLQGSLSFSKTNPNTNIPLYKEILRFMQGDQGLAGSGGQLANRLSSPQGFQASHVFDSQSTRLKVQHRLETQLTEYLNQRVGEQAKANNMSVPEFLQSQGIRGIRETGRGDNKRLTLYSPESFIESSQNPITGSTEKMARSYMKQIGAVNKVSGGTNEGRRLSAFLRPDEAKYVNDMIRNTAFNIEAGTYNKGDMEALYGSTAQRTEAKLKQTALKNDLTSVSLESRNPATIEEIKSKILKQHAQKQAWVQAEQELVATGQLPDQNKSDREKDRKQSPAVAAAKGMVSVVLKIFDTITSMKALFSGAVGYLQSISSVVGGLIKNSGPLGIDSKEASKLMLLGALNPVYSGGNDNVMLEAGKSAASNVSNIIKSGQIDFTNTAFEKHPDLISKVISMSLADKPQPVEIMKTVFGNLASGYFSISKDNEKARAKQLAEDMLVIESLLGGPAAEGYRFSVQTAEAINLKQGAGEKFVNKHNAHNIVNLLEETVSGKEKKDSLGNTLNKATGLRVDSGFGSKSDIAVLNEILGTLEAIKLIVMKLALANMDTIIMILKEIALGILGLAAFFERDENGPMQQALKSAKDMDKEAGKIGFKGMLGTAAQIRKSLETELDKVGYKGLNADKFIEDYINPANKPEEVLQLHKDIFAHKNARDLIISFQKYREIRKNMKAYGDQHPEDKGFLGSGDMDSLFQNNIELNRLLDKYNFKPVADPDYEKVKNQKIEESELQKEQRRDNKATTTGVYGLNQIIPSNLMEYKNRDVSVKIPDLKFLNTLSSVAQLSSFTNTGSLPVVPQDKEPFKVVVESVLTVNGEKVSSKTDSLSSDSQRRTALSYLHSKVNVG